MARKKIDYTIHVIKREDLYYWPCHLCFDMYVKQADAHQIHFLDGSFLLVCAVCIEKCLSASIKIDLIKPKIGYICSEKFATLVREMHCN
jgi:hypothetical protein